MDNKRTVQRNNGKRRGKPKVRFNFGMLIIIFFLSFAACFTLYMLAANFNDDFFKDDFDQTLLSTQDQLNVPESAAASSDQVQMVKLYPEGNAEARFKIRGVKKILFYCNRDGLYSIDVVKGIDDKENGYDDSKERRELEKAAEMLFG